MDVKLAEYRARKRKEATIQKSKESFYKLFSFMLENKNKVWLCYTTVNNSYSNYRVVVMSFNLQS